MSCLNPCGLLKLPFGAGAMTMLGAAADWLVRSLAWGEECVCVEEIMFCNGFLSECGLCLKL